MSKCPTCKQEVPRPKCPKCRDTGLIAVRLGRLAMGAGRCECLAGLTGGPVVPRDIADYKEPNT